MHTLEKLLLGFLMLGTIPGGILAMSDADEAVFMDAVEEPYEDYVRKNWKIVLYEDSSKPTQPPVVHPKRAFAIQHPVTEFPQDGGVIYQDLKGIGHEHAKFTIPEIVLQKIDPLLTPKVIVALTGLVLTITGLRYLYVTSVIKQKADLESLRTNCDTVLQEILKGNVDPEVVEVPLMHCSGLSEALQDKLDDTLTAYNLTLQQTCHALCACQPGNSDANAQVQDARKAMAICHQVIDECEQVLVKKPTMVDAMVAKGSVWAQALRVRVQSAATAITHRLRPSKVQKA